MNIEATIRAVAFLSAATCLGACEVLWPRRSEAANRRVRWPGNLGVMVLASALARLLSPFMPVGLAEFTWRSGSGLLPWSGLPFFFQVVAGFCMLDLVIYFQHRLFHAWRPLWRLHRMHHADLVLDFTSGGRFHPLEFMLSLTVKLVAIAALAPPPLAVLLFEICLNVVSMFNHANVRLPRSADRLLRLAVVTPDMHLVHHSVAPREFNSNFGFNLPWWDFLFRTYVPQPAQGLKDMQIGLNIFRAARDQTFSGMLSMPFR